MKRQLSYPALCTRRDIPVLVMEFHHLNGSAGRVLFPDVLQDLGPDAHGKHRVSSFAFGRNIYPLQALKVK